MQNLFIHIVSKELDLMLKELGLWEHSTSQVGQIGTGVSPQGYFYKSFGVPTYKDLIDCGTDTEKFFCLLQNKKSTDTREGEKLSKLYTDDCIVENYSY